MASVAAQALEFVVSPSFTGSPNPGTAQVGVLSLEANRPVTVEAVVTGGDEQWTLGVEPAQAAVEKPILGLKPSTTYRLDVTVSSGDEQLTASGLSWTTPALPAGFPRFDVVSSTPGRMEPGMTLFNARSPALDFLVIVDNEGTVRWYSYNPESRVEHAHRRLAGGDFLYIEGINRLVELDVFGNEVTSWYASTFPLDYTPPSDSIPVAVDTMHHEVKILEGGVFLTLSSRLRTVESFPTSETDPNAPMAPAQVVDNEILEFRPTGEIVEEISLMDILDPQRIGRDSLTPNFWQYGEDSKDWAHANAVVYDDADDSYVVSLRHQDAVIKIRRSTRELVWILGSPTNWREPWASKLLTPVGELSWPYHQHAVELTDEGIGLYDNGNYRAGAFEEPITPEYSRAVLYKVDEENMTVEQIWSYGSSSGEDSFFSSFMGDADWQPTTGNVLITSGALVSQKFGGSTYGQVLEVSAEGERLFQLDMGDPTDSGSAEHYIYRSERIPDIRE